MIQQTEPAATRPSRSTLIPTIALCMIVRDEAAVIRRCLASVRHLIDSWVIVDTGSTDGTPEVVTEALRDIPGALHHRPWRNFGSNRSEALTLAAGAADYLLLLDADMTLSQHGPLPDLDADAYLLEFEGPLAYSVPRLVRSNLPWRYEGATHEYLTSDSSYRQERLPALTVHHHGDGGSRGDKLARDRALLEAQLVATPDDPRTVFYLAQTCHDQGDLERATTLYGLRAGLGGWDEEVFYAAFQHAMAVADRDWPAGRDLLVSAWERRPSRAEPLYELAVRARDRGEHALAAWATELGMLLPLPTDLLFVHRWVHEWGMRLERSIACANTGNLAEAWDLTEALLAEAADLPGPVVDALRSNREWLAPRHRRGSSPTGFAGMPLVRRCPGTELHELPTAAVPPGWAPTNPSIAGDGHGFRAVVRTVNFQIDEDGGYTIDDPDGVVRTRNVLARLAADLTLTGARELDDVGGPPRHPSRVVGLEDCRLIAWRGGWWAAAACRDRSADWRCQEVLASVGDRCLEVHAVLPGPDPGRHEKNWMPFVVGKDLCFVYACRPFTVLRWGGEGAGLGTARVVATDLRLAALRGGSQGLPVDDGWLFVVHQVIHPAGRRRYLHRFLAVDGSLTPSGLSPPFTFTGAAVEFCAGIAAQGDNVVLSFGVGDARSALAVVPLDEIVDMIEPLCGGASAATGWRPAPTSAA